MKKYFVLLGILFSTINLIAQTDSIPNSSNSDKTVTLIVTGQGKTIDEARTNALRSAIEQTFGAFISTKTEVLNDSLVKDDVISVSNGNIQKFVILNEPAMPNGLYSSTINATVSINKLTNYCNGKGITVEFKGGLFAANMALQELQEKNEKIAWNQIKNDVIDKLIQNSIDSKIEVNAPQFIIDTNYSVPINITISINKNWESILIAIQNFCMFGSLEDIESYNKIGKKVYPINIFSKKNNFRNEDVRNEIFDLPYNIIKVILNGIRIDNGIGKYSLLNLNILKNKTFKSDEKIFTKINMSILGQKSHCVIYSPSMNFIENNSRYVTYDCNKYIKFDMLTRGYFSVNIEQNYFGIKYQHSEQNRCGSCPWSFDNKKDLFESMMPFILRYEDQVDSYDCNFEKIIGEYLKIETNQNLSISQIKQISDYKVYMEKE